MNDDELITVVKDAVAGVHMTVPTEQITRRSRTIRARRRIPALAGALGVVAGAALAVTMVLSAGHQPARPGHAQLVAWTVAKQTDGTIRVTIRELRDPAGLQARLRADAVPAKVVFLQHSFVPTTSPSAIPRPCRAPHMSGKANATLQGKIMPFPGAFGLSPSSVVLVIRPSAIPRGIGLFVEAFAANPGSSGSVFDMTTDLVVASPQCTGS